MIFEGVTADHWQQAVREACEADFTYFVRYFFKRRKGTKFIFNAHHRVLCDDLMRVHRGEITNYIANTPPRYSKTELIVVMFSAWCFMKNPRCEFIHLSYADPLVLENSDAIREIVKSAEFRALWPHITVKVNKDSKKAWDTEQGGKFYATSSGGQVTGFGAGRLDEVREDGEFVFSGCLLIDDPLKPDDARSDSMRKYVNERWDNTFKSRRNGPRTPTIVVMQRLHEDDFTAMLKCDTEFEWFVREMRALVDEDLPTERALWPAKHTVEALHAMKRKNSYMFAGQMQQRPAPLGGGLIRGEWFRRYDVPPPIMYRKIYADTAQKTSERHDYSVFQCWGAGDDKRIYLLDQIRGKWEAPELRRRALAFWAKHMAVVETGTLRQMRIEDKASGTGLIQDIRMQGHIPVYAQQRNRDKFLRVGDGTPYIEAGLVCIPEAAPFTQEFIDENESFTADDTHANDDQIDPMLDAIEDMLSSLNSLKPWEDMI
jgi:predicted phage terminase large subunit-like protein